MKMKFKIILLTSLLTLHSSNAIPFFGLQSKLKDVSKKIGVSANVDVSLNHKGGIFGSVNKHLGFGFGAGAHHEASSHGNGEVNAGISHESQNNHHVSHEQNASHQHSASHEHNIEINGNSQHGHHHDGSKIDHQHEHNVELGGSVNHQSGHSKEINIGLSLEHNKNVNINGKHEHKHGHKHGHSHIHKHEHSKNINIQLGHKVEHSKGPQIHHSHDHSKNINIQLGHKVEDSKGPQIHHSHDYSKNIDIQLGHKVEHSRGDSQHGHQGTLSGSLQFNKIHHGGIQIDHQGQHNSDLGGSINHQSGHSKDVNIGLSIEHNKDVKIDGNHDKHINLELNHKHKHEHSHSHKHEHKKKFNVQLGHKIEHSTGQNIQHSHGLNKNINIQLGHKVEHSNDQQVHQSKGHGGNLNIQFGHKVEQSNGHNIAVSGNHGGSIPGGNEHAHSGSVNIHTDTKSHGSSGGFNIHISGKTEGDHIKVTPSGNLGGFENIHTNQVKDNINKIESGHKVEQSHEHGINLNIQHHGTENPHKVDLSSNDKSNSNLDISFSGSHSHSNVPSTSHVKDIVSKLEIKKPVADTSVNHQATHSGGISLRKDIAVNEHSHALPHNPDSENIQKANNNLIEKLRQIGIKFEHEKQNHLAEKVKTQISHLEKVPNSSNSKTTVENGHSGSLNIAINGDHTYEKSANIGGGHVKNVVTNLETKKSQQLTVNTNHESSHSGGIKFKIEKNLIPVASDVPGGILSVKGIQEKLHDLDFSNHNSGKKAEINITENQSPAQKLEFKKNTIDFINKSKQHILKGGVAANGELLPAEWNKPPKNQQSNNVVRLHAPQFKRKLRISGQALVNGGADVVKIAHPIGVPVKQDGGINIGINKQIEHSVGHQTNVAGNKKISGSLNIGLSGGHAHQGLGILNIITNGVKDAASKLKNENHGHVDVSVNHQTTHSGGLDINHKSGHSSNGKLEIKGDTHKQVEISGSHGGSVSGNQEHSHEGSVNHESGHSSNGQLEINVSGTKQQGNSGAEINGVIHKQIEISGNHGGSISGSHEHSHEGSGGLNIVLNGIKNTIPKLENEKSSHINLSVNHQTTQSSGSDVNHESGHSSNGQLEINVSGTKQQGNSGAEINGGVHKQIEIFKNHGGSSSSSHSGFFNINTNQNLVNKVQPENKVEHKIEHAHNVEASGSHTGDLNIELSGSHEHNHQSLINSAVNHVKDKLSKLESDKSGNIDISVHHESSHSSGAGTGDNKQYNIDLQHSNEHNADLSNSKQESENGNIEENPKIFPDLHKYPDDYGNLDVTIKHQQKHEQKVDHFADNQHSGGGSLNIDISGGHEHNHHSSSSASGNSDISGSHETSHSGGIEFHHSSEHDVHGSVENEGSSQSANNQHSSSGSLNIGISGGHELNHHSSSSANGNSDISGGHQSSHSGGIDVHHSSEHNVHGSVEHGGNGHVEISSNHGGLISGIFNKVKDVGKKVRDKVSNIGGSISLQGHVSGSLSHGASGHESGSSHSLGTSHEHSFNKNIEFGVHRGSSQSGQSQSGGGFGLNFGVQKQSSGNSGLFGFKKQFGFGLSASHHKSR